MSYPLLPGRIGQASTKSLALPVVGAALLLAALIGVLIIANREPQPQASTVSEIAAPATPAPTVLNQSLDPSPDVTFHLASIKAQLLSASEQVSRAQRLTAGIIPELTRNDLWQDRRRAEAAVAACENTKQAVAQALAELHLAIPTHKEN
jgi:hypothetical protein